MRNASVLIVIAWIAGCAQAPEKPGRFAAVARCAESVSTLPRVTLVEDGRALERSIDGSVSCMQGVDGHARPALLFALDRTQPAAELSVFTRTSKATTFAPAVSVLDADFAVMSRYSFERFVKRGADYGLTVFLDRDAAATYVLIAPDDAWLGKESLTVTSELQMFVWSNGFVAGAFINGGEGHHVSTFSDVGLLRVSLKPYAPTVLE
jgi:hypothetical protein